MSIDGPMVMVHKGFRPFKKQKVKSRSTSRSERESEASISPSSDPLPSRPRAKDGHFQFINTTKPGQVRQVDFQKRVRKHARSQRVEHGSVVKTMYLNSSLGNQASNDNNKPSIPYPLGPDTAIGISNYPFDIQPHTHVLLTNYLTYSSSRMFSLEHCLSINPLRSPQWFQHSATDTAMFHAMLYSAAVYMALLEGKTESRELVYHQNQTISIVQERLKSSSDVADSTLGAISCLALGEAVMGNRGLWGMHMGGLKGMLSKRGGIGSLSPLMKAKLRRSDVTGAFDYAATPFLNIERSTAPPTWSFLPQYEIENTEVIMNQLLTECEVHPQLIAAMINLAHFANAVKLAKLDPEIKLDTISFSEDLYTIEHDLLSFSSDQLDEFLLLSPYSTDLNNALRIGALLYIKSILHEFPHAKTGPTILLSQLRGSLSSIQTQVSHLQSAILMPVLGWLGTIGAMLAQGETKGWFMIFLRQSAVENGDTIVYLNDHTLMSGMLSLKEAFGMGVEGVWKDVQIWAETMSLFRSVGQESQALIE